MAPTSAMDITLINGVPYVTCGQCNGSGDNGVPPFCDECFGSGRSPLGASALRAAGFGSDLDARIQATHNGHGSGSGSGSGTGHSDQSNQFAGACIKCGGHVAANAGWRARDGQKWCTQHKIGECVAKTEAAAPANVRSNRYPGKCAVCGEMVPAEAGVLKGVRPKFTVEHLVCPEVVTEVIVQSSQVNPTAELVARLAAVLDYVLVSNREFAGSMVEQFGRKGYLSPKQIPYVEQFTLAAEEAAAEDMLRPITESILARAQGNRASLRFAIPSGGHNDLDFLCVFKGRVERHIGAPGDGKPLAQKLATAPAVTLANRIMDLDDAAFTAAQALYGQSLAYCGRCSAALTDKLSRSRGLGPECYGKS